jgi:hypothetical protein
MRWLPIRQRDTIPTMSSVADIEIAIQQLPPEELAKFREWFAQFDADKWDQQFEADALAGRLDKLAAEAIGDLRNERTSDL